MFELTEETLTKIAVKTPEMIWRWQVASLCIPSFALLCGVTFICWDSPRFLMKHEEARKAAWQRLKAKVDRLQPFSWWEIVRTWFMPSLSLPYQSPTVETFRLLRSELIVAYKEILLVHCQILMENEDCNRSGEPFRRTSRDLSLPTKARWLRRIWRLKSSRTTRRQAKAAAAVMISQQLCG